MRSLQTLVRIGAAAAAMCMALTSQAQITFEKLFTGEGMKPLAVADLSASYHAYRLGGPQGADPSSMYANPMSMMFGVLGSTMSQAIGSATPTAEGDTVNPMVLFTMIGVYWTKGDIIDIENAEFLIGYTVNLNMAAMSSGKPPATMGEVVSLDPQLIRLSTVTSISPLNNLTADKFKEMLAKKMEDSSGGSVPAAMAEEPIESSGITTPTVDNSEMAQPAISAADRTKTLSNAKQIALAMMMYSADYDDKFPSAQSTGKVKEQIRPYTKNDLIWQTFNPNGSEFRYNVRLSVMSSSMVENPAQTPLLFESKAWPDGKRVVGFADGHVTIVSDEQWSRIAAKYKLKT